MSGTINEGDTIGALARGELEGLAGLEVDSGCRGMMAGDRFYWLILKALQFTPLEIHVPKGNETHTPNSYSHATKAAVHNAGVFFFIISAIRNPS